MDNESKKIKDKKNRIRVSNANNELQNANSYTFEIYGTGDITIYAMERVDRTHTR